MSLKPIVIKLWSFDNKDPQEKVFKRNAHTGWMYKNVNMNFTFF